MFFECSVAIRATLRAFGLVDSCDLYVRQSTAQQTSNL